MVTERSNHSKRSVSGPLPWRRSAFWIPRLYCLSSCAASCRTKGCWNIVESTRLVYFIPWHLIRIFVNRETSTLAVGITVVCPSVPFDLEPRARVAGLPAHSLIWNESKLQPPPEQLKAQNFRPTVECRDKSERWVGAPGEDWDLTHVVDVVYTYTTCTSMTRTNQHQFTAPPRPHLRCTSSWPVITNEASQRFYHNSQRTIRIVSLLTTK